MAIVAHRQAVAHFADLFFDQMIIVERSLGGWAAQRSIAPEQRESRTP